MYIKEFLIFAFLAILTPILDIPPDSLFIVGAYLIALFFWLIAKNNTSLSSSTIKLTFFWLFLSLMGLLFSVFLGFLERTSDFENFFNYLVRIMVIALIFFSFALFKFRESPKQSFVLIADYLFAFIILSTCFEIVTKYVGLESILNLYKAREDIGGIDTVHYNRLSGFWSFPGDMAAILIFSMSLNFFSGTKNPIIKNFVCMALLIFTQSKAGIVFILGYLFLMVLRRFSPRFFIAAAFTISLGIFVLSNFEFQYLIRFFNDYDWYLSSSKRVQELELYLNSSLWEQFIGIKNQDYMYESEILGSLSRVGIIGSAWWFLLFSTTLYFSLKSRNFSYLWVMLLSFLLIYCSISAGLSRYKVSILFYILFFVGFFFETRNRKFKGQNHSF